MQVNNGPFPLICFIVYTRDTGKSKKSYEKQGEGEAAGRSIRMEGKRSMEEEKE